ncbi:N-acylneuraminate cytidylyltransferase [Daejeonella rubra]|uniref:N-acylneuraminate cytidylyltransferase n=1 Tax=Daejeonella rubra TaxID=990371 RepID=A0A1G9WTS9_9SPHI|nr:acylneuraminate cytidylyltransferase family protein [Daejeonella rubra]SDM87898.1 N-acylneuraminate cytidylyltransferase [Daejeonella rubra]
MNILITICGRGGSKGIPGKNVKLIGGKPLITYTIDIANKFAAIHKAKIALSTDDAQIKLTAEKLGLFTEYTRPDILASDVAGKIDTIADILKYEEQCNSLIYDFILDLDITSPMRTLSNLEQSFEILRQNEQAQTLFSVNPAARNPYFNMVEEGSNGFYTLVKKAANGSVMSRQAAPKVYELNASFYWYRRSFFYTGAKSPITDRSLIYEMDHLCFDLDHMNDFEYLEFLLLNNKVVL